jgi:glycosyltransferase involved in cell wall biosynthesis
MNIVLVNPVHPSTPHVSAVRTARFGIELAKLGHRVVLLCAAPDGAGDDTGDTVRSRDWAHPYVLATKQGRPARDGGARVALFRRLETMSRMLLVGGYQSCWVRAAVDAMSAWAADFPPNVIWVTFGKMEAVIAARRLARRLDVPWVLDLKDNWELFVPRGLRRAMALRTLGWVALTANSELTRDRARIWQRDEATVVYSGVDEVYFARDQPAPQDDTFTINLIGGLYVVDRVLGLLDGIGRWLERIDTTERPRVRVCYLGSDAMRFEECVAARPRRFESIAIGYVAPEQLASACRRAAVNAYVVHDGGFHHKLLELLACGHPLIAYPAERAESRRLAAQMEGELLEPADPAAVARVLEAAHRRWSERRPSSPQRSPARYSWPAQTRMLEGVLTHVARS